LSWEQWNDIFESTNVNNMFNNFLNTFLRSFYTSFKKKKKKLDVIITETNRSLMGYEFHVKERENSSYYVDTVMMSTSKHISLCVYPEVLQ
jgi:hypothetical protein